MDYYFPAVISLTLLIPLVSGTLSTWGDWSACSRTCGLGVLHRTRECGAGGACEGEDHTQYTTCRMQSCPDGSPDFRAAQCSQYGNQAYNGEFLQWTPCSDETRPCTLVCQAKQQGVTVTQTSEALDGSSCSQHSKGICIDGTCKTIGCDDILDSDKAFDSCGVCGGDGTSCNTTLDIPIDVLTQQVLPLNEDIHTLNDKSNKYSNHKLAGAMDKTDINGLSGLPRRVRVSRAKESFRNNLINRVIEVPFYVWEESAYSECSVTCGTGKQRTKVTCKNPKTNEIVIDRFCTQQKPPHHAKTCVRRSCTAKWVAGRWGPCSASCGGGLSSRNVFCVMSGEKVDDLQCVRTRPDTRQKCNQNPCPQWQPGQWSKCSVTCGVGEQYRDVVCKRDSEAEGCSDTDKPVVKQRCHTGIICAGQIVVDHQDQLPFDRTPDDNQITEDDRGGVDGEDYHQEALERPSVYDVYWGNTEEENDSEDYSRGGGSSTEEDTDYYDRGGGFSWEEEYDNKIGGEARVDGGEGEGGGTGGDVDYRGNEILELEEDGSGGGEEVVIQTDVPRFVPSVWGPCDVTCGHGLRHRQVECKVLTQYSSRARVLADHMCQDRKPPTTKSCIEENCPIVVDSVDSKTFTNGYAWRFSGHGPCTATCGGGFREPLFKCVRSDPHTMILVATELCATLSLPTIFKTSCNDWPCPARWQIYPYGRCSHPCGGGFSTREVTCVRDQGDGSSLTVPQQLCTEETPPTTRLCNQVSCPPTWYTDSFSQCSASCGQGKKTRSVECRQIIHPNREERKLDDAFCPQGSKPQSRETCQMEPCAVVPEIRPDNSYYVQLQQRKQLRFVAGGTIVIIPGTVLKIRCHVVHFEKTKIVWTKNGNAITRRGRTKRSRRGVLHIRGVKVTDAGVYTCYAGDVSTKTSVRVHTAQEALEKFRFRENENARDPDFLNIFRQVIKQSGANRKEEYTEPFLLRHFENQNILPFQFITTAWGRCSKSCGGAGLQRRQITCEINLDQYYLVVGDQYCYNKGLDKPLTEQDCGYQVCPQWDVGDWGNRCTDEHCLSYEQGVRLRPLYCIDTDGSHLDHAVCDRKKRPRDKQGCLMETCVPKWIASDWTDCSITCGGEGIHTRSLRCVWEPNNKSANGMCENLPKPDVIKPCQTPACDDSYCRDESNYCSLVQSLNLCRYAEYRGKCCASCTLIGRGPARMRRYHIR